MKWLEFIEAPLFTELLVKYLPDDAYRALQVHLARDPQAGSLIPGTGGFRKLRWVDPRRARGKRGGLRVVYYHLVGDDQIWLMTVYGKGEVDDLRPDEERALKAAIELELQRRATLRRVKDT